MRIENAKITGTMLGIEDHGILTFQLSLELGGWSMGYGGYACDGGDGTKANNFLARAVRGLLDALQVRCWEELKGKYVRVQFSDDQNRIIAVGHIIEDRWLNLKLLAESAGEHK